MKFKNNIALKITVFYIFLSSVWIIVSDFLIIFLFKDLTNIAYVSILKGLFFVFVTALFLFLYIKKQSGELKESEEKYKNLFQNHKTPMLILDPADGSIIDANYEAEKFYGHSLDELKELKIFDISVYGIEETKVLLKMTLEGKESVFNVRHKLKNGDIRDVEVHSSPFKIKEKVFLFTLIFDITSKLAMEKENKDLLDKLISLNENLTNLIENSPLPIVSVNMEGHTLVWNNAAEKTFGWPKEEVIGKFNPVLEDDFKIKFFKLVEHIKKGNVIKDLEINRFNKEGKYLTLRAFVSPLYDAKGNINAVLAMFDDITERKKIQEEIMHVKKMESVGKLAAGISHDINNMLTGIVGFATLMEMETKENNKLNHYARQILAISEKVSYLTKSLLTYSRKHPYDPKPLDLNELIKSSLGFIDRIIGEGVEIKLKLSDISDKILGDPYHIEQILVNLLTNAKDAMPEGGTIFIETSSEILDENFIKIHKYGKVGKFIRLTITDTGIGMDEETKEKAFDPFYTTKDVGKGTGLGLSIVYGIVKQHNGYISLYSEKGKGTTIKIYFPCMDKIGNFEEPPKDELRPIMPDRVFILLADDDDIVRATLKNFLISLGYNVYDARDGKEALTIFEELKDKINLLLLDVIMPGLNGYEIYKKISQAREDIKTIFMSGYPIEVVKNYIPGNSYSLVHKPISVYDLIKKINELISFEENLANEKREV